MIRVLIVDDEYIMRQGLKYMINWEQEGYEIVGEATNGKEALKLIPELLPHIIICDIVMPLLDGVDFAEVVHQMYPQIQTIILSGYDNFEYVKTTLMSGVVDYILKPTLNQEELKKILARAAKRIPGYKLEPAAGVVSYERMMERYLLGHDKQLDVAKISDCFSGSCFRLYAVNIKKENEAGQNMSDVLYKKIEREMGELREVQKLIVTLREELVCVIFSYELSMNKKLMQMLENLNNALVLLCGDVLGVCSRSFHSFGELYEIYQQDIVKNVDKAFYYEEEKLLWVENHKEEVESGNLKKFDFFRYNHLLSAKQYQEALNLLSQYNESALAIQSDVYGLKNQMKNMIYHFLDFLAVPDEEKDNSRYLFFRDIGNASYESEYRKCVNDIMKQMLEMTGNNKASGDARIEKMLAYIAQNYKEDLTLEDVAEEFNFNYHYLSAYFNQQMKEGFSDYLNSLRIEQACKLLKETNHSIAQISGEVGYSEHSYFCRVFKKITGKTPSVWRRGYHED